MTSAEVVLQYRPEGWNNVPGFDGALYTVADAKGKPLFEPLNFPPEDGFVYVRDWPDEPLTVEAK